MKESYLVFPLKERFFMKKVFFSDEFFNTKVFLLMKSFLPNKGPMECRI